MKKKRLAALAVAFALVLSLSVSVFAFTGITLGEFISMGFNKGDFPDYTYAEWESMSIDERRSALESPVIKYRGTPHFTDDFLSDTKNSHNAYEGFVNGYSVVGGFIPNIASSIYLEKKGQADLRLGFYNDDYNGTAAGELNNDFLDYIQKYPFSSVPLNGGTLCKFPNGYSISWEPIYNYSHNPYSPCFVDGKSYIVYSSGVRLFLHNSDGVMIDKSTYCYGLDGSFYAVGSFAPGLYEDYHNCYLFDPNYFVIEFFDVGTLAFKSSKLSLPWNYGVPTAEPVVTDPVATGTDENGNEIQFNINSDGVTYEGNTYNYNDDNSVTINGNTYHITVNPADVNEDYYNQFLQQIINNYYNYYCTDETPFDGKDILTSLKSIFDSLEKFRSSCYTQLKETADYIFDGFNSMSASLKKIIDRLDDIIKYLKDIGGTLDDISEEKKQEYNTKWLEAIGKVKKKFCYDEIKANIDNCYNAMFNAEYSETEQAAVVATFAYNDGSGAEPIKKNGTFLPAITVEIFGQEYDLLSCIGSFTPYMDGIKDIISMFLIITFILSLFRSLPAMIGGVSSVVTSTPQFQDFSDKTEVEFYRSKYDR